MQVIEITVIYSYFTGHRRNCSKDFVNMSHKKQNEDLFCIAQKKE